MSVLKYAFTASRESIYKRVSRQLGEPVAFLNGAYAVWQGTNPVALVSHVDTVLEHSRRKLILNWNKKGIVSGKFGLGADDRAGVGMILSVIESGLKPWVILCDDEEIGCVGAAQLAKDVPKGFDNISAMIELDRRGSNDVVYYDMDLDTPDAAALRYFLEYEAKYTKAWGTFSDISVLADEWQIAAANLSVGYYNEHTHKEFLVVNEWRRNMERVKLILESMKDLDRLVYESDYKSYQGWRTSSGSYETHGYGTKTRSCMSGGAKVITYTSQDADDPNVWSESDYIKDRSRIYYNHDVCYCGTKLIADYCSSCDRYPHMGG